MSIHSSEKLVFCMKWGTRYGPEYVNRLWRGVRKHTRGDVRLVCFTDDASGIDEGVDCRPLPPFPGVPEHLSVKPWKKLSLWQKDLAPDLNGRDALFLDVDLVLVGSLDAFWEYAPGLYCVWENPTKAGKLVGGQPVGNTSVFRFTVGSHPEIYDRFVADPVGMHQHQFRIEQEFISATLGAKGVQRFWPKGWCCSFKEDLLPAWPQRWWTDVPLPEACRVAVFHGKPDPDEAMRGEWPAKGWKKIYKHVRPVQWVADNWE